MLPTLKIKGAYALYKKKVFSITVLWKLSKFSSDDFLFNFEIERPMDA